MERLRRWVVLGLALVSLLLSIAWGVSEVTDFEIWIGNGHTIRLSIWGQKGFLGIYAGKIPRLDGSLFSMKDHPFWELNPKTTIWTIEYSYSASLARTVRFHDFLGDYWGFSTYWKGGQPILRDAAIGVNFWHMVVITGFPICLELGFKLRKQFVRREGICRNCGYDLRATPDRCPECGTNVSEKARS